MARVDEWYPSDAEGQAMFQENLAVNLPKLAVKYGVPPATAARVAANAAWMRFWVDYRAAFAMESEQLTKYYNARALGKDAEGDITAPIITPPDKDNTPPEVVGDVRTFTFALRREMVNKPNFSTADGELLGFTKPVSAQKPDNEITPTFKLRTLTNFDLEATFTKQGMDAMRFEVRHKGGAWQSAATLTNSPGEFNGLPTNQVDAAQIEVRAILLRKNQPAGNYSAIQTALIAP